MLAIPMIQLQQKQTCTEVKSKQNPLPYLEHQLQQQKFVTHLEEEEEEEGANK